MVEMDSDVSSLENVRVDWNGYEVITWLQSQEFVSLSDALKGFVRNSVGCLE